ncbi:MAG: M23 family metallopeptidase [Saprospiraceae bacterium]|nr:M23 family metallopeptidase [Saprospiraceae bacterium]
MGKATWRITRLFNLSIFYFVVISMGFAQGSDDLETIHPDFMSPVDHTIRLAGSFGELRSNHFHAGIDIKSKTGKVGDVVRATAPGYVSRIKIQRGGYGQVLYIDHPNGYTSVYAHLKEFSDTLQQYIVEKQYQSRSYEIDVYPEPRRFTFDQGEVVGLMGNTGRSYGPHLHFEIRKTDTEIPENPYLHGLGPEDTRPPLIYAIEAHGLNNEHQKIWSKSLEVNNPVNTSPTPSNTIRIPAWRTGFAIQTFDLMNGASNKNGIYTLEMLVDDSLYFSHKMDRVGFDVSRYINSHIDYEAKKKNNRTFTKCYVSPGNKLTFYPNLTNFGEVKLYKDTPRKVDFIVKDFAGNTNTFTCFAYRREAKKGEIKEKPFQKYLLHTEMAKISLGSCRFVFPRNTFDKNTYINYEETNTPGQFSFKINTASDPLFSYPGVSIPVSGIDSSLHEKVVLIYDEKTSYGGHVEGDSLRVRIGSFGKYSIHIDTIPPTIDVGSFLKNAKGKPFFRFAIYDNYETKGYAEDIKYDVFIDGEWVIASLKALGNVLIVPLDEIPSGRHTLKIRVEDHSKNINTWERTFTN